MVLGTLLDISIRTTYYIGSTAYYGIKYLIYGEERTKDQLMLEELTETVNSLNKKIEELNKSNLQLDSTDNDYST